MVGFVGGFACSACPLRFLLQRSHAIDAGTDLRRGCKRFEVAYSISVASGVVNLATRLHAPDLIRSYEMHAFNGISPIAVVLNPSFSLEVT
jgi:hypothetical protein